MSETYGNRILFVTLCDEESVHRADNLKKTLKGNLIILDTYDHSIGNFSKLTKFRDFLISFPLCDDDIICFVDAFDMLCTCYDPQQMIQVFKNYKKDIIFGAEIFCGPEHTTQVCEYFVENEGELFLNGGFQIGYKKSLLDFHNYIHDNFDVLKSRLEIDRNTEQGILSQVYITGLFQVGLDRTRRLVNNIVPDFFDRDDMTLLYPSFFTHVIRSGTNVKNFKETPEIREMYEAFLRGEIKYNKHIDMLLRKDTYEKQENRYMNIVKHVLQSE